MRSSWDEPIADPRDSGPLIGAGRPPLRAATACLVMAFVVCLPSLRAGRSPAASQVRAEAATPPRIDRQAPPVTFKTEVDYIEVDAVVVDGQGRAVEGLARDDFEVLEDGKAQKISVFAFVNLPVPRIEKRLVAKQASEPDVQTNERGAEGRIYLLVLDDLHTDPMRSQRGRLAARRFLQEQMGAGDVAAVAYTSGRADAAQSFTASRQLLLAAVDKFSGRKVRSATLEKLDQKSLISASPSSPSDPLESERAYNARAAFDAVRQLSGFLAGIHSRRKALIYIGEGVDYDVDNLIAETGTPNASAQMGASVVRDSARDAIAAATRANVSIYSIDPRGLAGAGREAMEVQSPGDVGQSGELLRLGQQTLLDEMRLSQGSLRTMSEETGGFAVLNTNDLNGAFDRIVQDNSSYYVLGYRPVNDRRDGTFRRIDVKVKRPGVQVRSQRGYVAPKGKAPATRAAGPSPTVALEVRDVLESPLPTPGFTLSTCAAFFKGKARNASVVVTTQGSGRDLAFVEKASRFADVVDVSVIAVDQAGKIHGADQRKVNMALSRETRSRVQETGFRTLSRFDLPAGRYQLRVAARDANSGRIGSVYYDLTVPDLWTPPLSMSAIVIASTRSSGIATPHRDEHLSSILPGPPTTTREFANDEELTVLAEVYDNQPATAHLVEVRTTVLSEDGSTVFSHRDDRASGELNNGTGGFGYVVTIPLTTVTPGLYVLRIEARSTNGTSDPIKREVPFSVRRPPTSTVRAPS